MQLICFEVIYVDRMKILLLASVSHEQTKTCI
jgi:hypothetical protein